MEEYLMQCWFCNSQFDASEASFCSHIDPTLICPYCVKCACDAPEEYIKNFLKNCPKKILEEKLILESRTSLKLGEILIRAGKITRGNLIAAIERQKIFKKRIGQIFIMMNLLTPDELSLYLMEQQNIEKIDLENFEIDFALVEEIGKDFCLAQKIIPVEFYETNNEKILRFIIYSIDDLLKLRNCKELKDYILLPLAAPHEDTNRLLKEIKESDILVLK
jgi:hypothetical protein